MKTKVQVINDKSYAMVDKKGNMDVFFNCPHCGKPITKTSKEWGMDCEDECGKKEALKIIKHNPLAKLFHKFLQQ
jgi:DNA-directed RNA polymerase subunit RPC12/RpoP